MFFLLFLLAALFIGPALHIEPPQASFEDMQAVADANNQFALDFYSEIDDEGNIFFSPFSISSAIAMTYEGAQGQTAKEMKEVFHFPEEDVMRPAFEEIYNWVNRRDEEYELHTANALWAQEDYPFIKDYFNLIKRHYGGEITNVDFKTDSEGVRQRINDWVESQTNNKILNLIPSGAINSITRLVLTNAIYFKGTWVLQFNKDDTMERNFRVNQNYTVNVPTMKMVDEKFNYAETDDLQILEMPYDGESLSMLILLPKDDWLGTLGSIDANKLSELRGILVEQEVDVYLPKFKLETKYFMKPALVKMGMPTAFSGAADFSGITETNDLTIDEVIHQAFVEVDEEGTEAAAATAVIMKTTSVGPTKPIFQADHPFMFVIQERESGGILFLGRVSDPSQ